MVKFIESELVLLKKEIDEMWTLVYNQLDRAGKNPTDRLSSGKRDLQRISLRASSFCTCGTEIWKIFRGRCLYYKGK